MVDGREAVLHWKESATSPWSNYRWRSSIWVKNKVKVASKKNTNWRDTIMGGNSKPAKLSPYKMPRSTQIDSHGVIPHVFGGQQAQQQCSANITGYKNRKNVNEKQTCWGQIHINMWEPYSLTWMWSTSIILKLFSHFEVEKAAKENCLFQLTCYAFRTKNPQ